MSGVINWLLSSYNWLCVVGVLAFVASVGYTMYRVRRWDFR